MFLTWFSFPFQKAHKFNYRCCESFKKNLENWRRWNELLNTSDSSYFNKKQTEKLLRHFINIRLQQLKVTFSLTLNFFELPKVSRKYYKRAFQVAPLVTCTKIVANMKFLNIYYKNYKPHSGAFSLLKIDTKFPRTHTQTRLPSKHELAQRTAASNIGRTNGKTFRHMRYMPSGNRNYWHP